MSKTKVYEECINCARIGDSCNGPNFFNMDATQLLLWCKKRKVYLKLTNLKLAELSGVPKGTIDRLFAGEHMDFKFESLRPIIKVLIGGDFATEICPKRLSIAGEAKEETEEKLNLEIADLKGQLKEANAQHRQDISRVKSESKTSVDYLKQHIKYQKRIIAIMGIVILFLLLLVVSGLIVDVLYNDRGFIWRSASAYNTAVITDTIRL